jgi:hypothetical protein
MDSGYPQAKGFMRPFRGEWYHLEEFRATGTPRGHKELFNHRHSSLWNVIERCFGVLKARFKILIVMTSYKTSKQPTIVTACCAVHNFIRMTADDDHLFTHWENEDVRTDDYESVGGSSSRHGRNLRNLSDSVGHEMAVLRESIAQHMWQHRND